MGKVNGYAPKKLPDSLIVGLEGLGYVALGELKGVTKWKTVKHRHLFLVVSPSNLPGDEEYVVAQFHGQHATRLTVDMLLARLTAQLALADQITVKMEVPS